MLWQLGRSLFGMPAGGPSRPLFVRSVLGSPPFSSQTVALFTQSYPADLEATLLQRGCNRGFRGSQADAVHELVSAGRLGVRDDSASAQ